MSSLTKLKQQVQIQMTGIQSNETPAEADIEEISLDLLSGGNKDEAARLLRACTKDGVFYLNLRGTDGVDGPLLRSSRDIYRLSKNLFRLPEAEKMRYDIDHHDKMKLNGQVKGSASSVRNAQDKKSTDKTVCSYKPLGRNKGGLSGNKDGFESYAIAKDFILGLDSTAANEDHPDPVLSDLPLLSRFANDVTAATTAILASLSTSLGFPPGTGFEVCHRAGVPAPDMLRLLKYSRQPVEDRGAPQTPHTDLGSLTVLFTQTPGLQRQNPRRDIEGDSAWEFVALRDGCAIVNVGDGMVALTNGLLHSCLHRVVPLPGRRMEERYSFAWMSRAEETTIMTGLEGGNLPQGEKNGKAVVTSGEWLTRKFMTLRK